MTNSKTATGRGNYDDLVSQIEADWSDPAAWEPDPAPTPQRPGRLAATVTLRLSPRLAEGIRAIANERGVAYTAMIREWIEERVAAAEAQEHAVIFLAPGTRTASPSAENLVWDPDEGDLAVG